MTEGNITDMRSEGVGAFLRVFVTREGIMLISEDATCIEVALETARTLDEVEDASAADQAGSDYVPPATPAPAGDEPSTSLFQYRIGLAAGTSAEGFAPALADILQRTFEETGQRCDVVLEG